MKGCGYKEIEIYMKLRSIFVIAWWQNQLPINTILIRVMNYIILLPFSTSTLQDILTDLNAEGEPLPIRPVNEEWMGHKVFYIFTIKSYYGVLICL